MKDLIRKYALQNAVKFKGKANPGAIFPKLIQEDPSVKSKAKELMPQIKEIVEEVNSLSPEEQLKGLQSSAPELLEKKVEKKEGLKELPNVGDKFVTRIAPSPSGPLHIGHAYVASLNYEYAKKYNGKFILRIEDTNPENIYEAAYEQIPEDLNWLTENGVAKVVVQSDRVSTYYKYAEKLFKSGDMYVCDCNPDEFKTMLDNGVACPCRGLEPSVQVDRWKRMLSRDGYDQGTAVVRFKSDINHKNPAMRDFPLLRINEATHPRTGDKYRVWPLMNFSVAIDDMDLGVTHALRGKDHADNAKRQALIHAALGVDTPEAVSVGKINFDGFEVSSSKTRAKIAEGEFSDWDDIRLPFLPALRRRGFHPSAFRKYAMEVGISKNDKSVPIDQFFKHVHALNKDQIDSGASRHFFVVAPQNIKIDSAPEQDVELDLHPDHKKGGRKFHTHEGFIISGDDLEGFGDGKLYRLMDCLNFVKKAEGLEFDSLDYETYKKHGAGIIHWLPASSENVNVEVMMPDGDRVTTITGVGEEYLTKLSAGDVIQLERFGFCRVDSVSPDKVVFWFGHK